MNWFIGINWSAIAVGTFAYYLLGAVWFTPLLRKAWDVAVGFERPKGYRFPAIYYVVPLLSALSVAIATAVVLNALDVVEVADAAGFGAIAGVGFAGAVSVNNAVAPNTPRPLLLGAVTDGYHLVGIVLLAVIVTAMS